jgi:hypothetical protein
MSAADVEVPYYWKSLDWDRLIADYPPSPIFERTVGRLSADALRELQERRFLARGWRRETSQRCGILRSSQPSRATTYATASHRSLRSEPTTRSDARTLAVSH